MPSCIHASMPSYPAADLRGKLPGRPRPCRRHARPRDDRPVSPASEGRPARRAADGALPQGVAAGLPGGRHSGSPVPRPSAHGRSEPHGGWCPSISGDGGWSATRPRASIVAMRSPTRRCSRSAREARPGSRLSVCPRRPTDRVWSLLVGASQGQVEEPFRRIRNRPLASVQRAGSTTIHLVMAELVRATAEAGCTDVSGFERGSERILGKQVPCANEGPARHAGESLHPGLWPSATNNFAQLTMAHLAGFVRPPHTVALVDEYVQSVDLSYRRPRRNHLQHAQREPRLRPGGRLPGEGPHLPHGLREHGPQRPRRQGPHAVVDVHHRDPGPTDTAAVPGLRVAGYEPPRRCPGRPTSGA